VSVSSGTGSPGQRAVKWLLCVCVYMTNYSINNITGKPHIENSDAVNWLHNTGILGIRNSDALLSCSQWPTLDHF